MIRWVRAMLALFLVGFIAPVVAGGSRGQFDLEDRLQILEQERADISARIRSAKDTETRERGERDLVAVSNEIERVKKAPIPRIGAEQFKPPAIGAGGERPTPSL